MSPLPPHRRLPQTARARLRRVRRAVLLTGLLLAGVTLAGGQPRADPAKPAPPLADKQRQVKQLAQEKAQIEDKLAYFKGSEQELRLEIQRLSQQVDASRQRKADLEARIKTATDKQTRLEKEIRTQQTHIRESRARIGLRLRRLYRLSKLSRSAYYFQIARYETFARDTRMLAMLQESDRAAIQQYEALVADTRTKQDEARKTLESLVSLREELAQESKVLGERAAFLKTSLQNLKKNQRLYHKYLRDLEKMMEGMEAAIRQLEAKSASEVATHSTPAPANLRGQLPPPAPGQIIAAFGEQDPRYDLKKLQRGIVIRVPPNATVQAVAAGTAVHAGPFRGYQQLVVLDHGQGLFTVYGHLRDLQVHKGDFVPKGAALGKPTFHPVDQAYDLYFEVRYKGVPEDPMTWLKPGGLSVAARRTP